MDKQQGLAHLDRLAVSGAVFIPSPVREPLWRRVVAIGGLLVLVLGATAVLYGLLQ